MEIAKEKNGKHSATQTEPMTIVKFHDADKNELARIVAENHQTHDGLLDWELMKWMKTVKKIFSKRDKPLLLEGFKDYLGCDPKDVRSPRVVEIRQKQKKAPDERGTDLWATKVDEDGRVPIKQRLNRVPCGTPKWLRAKINADPKKRREAEELHRPKKMEVRLGGSDGAETLRKGSDMVEYLPYEVSA